MSYSNKFYQSVRRAYGSFISFFKPGDTVIVSFIEPDILYDYLKRGLGDRMKISRNSFIGLFASSEPQQLELDLDGVVRNLDKLKIKD